MGLKVHLLLLLVLVVCGTYGSEYDSLWGSSESAEHGLATTPNMLVCSVRGKAGVCVGSQNCKTPYEGEHIISYRSANPCIDGVCCQLSDVITPPTSAPAIHNLKPITGCGVRNEAGIFFRNRRSVPSLLERIFKPNESLFGEFPWTVAIFKVNNDGKEEYSCVGSLVHPRVVLTVANRFVRGGKFRVRAGDWDLNSENEILTHENREVQSIVIHDSFSSGAGIYDASLLFLDRAINRSSSINYVCLPKSDEITQPPITCILSGWYNDQQEKQKMVEIPVVDRNICQRTLKEAFSVDDYRLHSSNMCAGGNDQDSSRVDGGTPLVCPYSGQNQRYYQAGILSWGIGGVQGIPGVYTDVAAIREWIDSNVIAEGFTTDYYTPHAAKAILYWR